MKVARSLIVALLKELEYGKADTWDNVKLLAKVKKLPSLHAETKPDIEDADAKKLFDQLVGEGSEKVIDELEITEDTKEDKKAKEKKGEAKTKEAKAKDKPAKKEKKEEAKKDAFGSREGSQAAAINKCITAKVVTVETIAKKTELATYRIKSHIASLIKAGKVFETEEGYTTEKPAKKAKK